MTDTWSEALGYLALGYLVTSLKFDGADVAQRNNAGLLRGRVRPHGFSILLDTNLLQICRGPLCDKLQTAKGGLSSTRRQLISHFAVGINAVILAQLLDDIISYLS